MQAEIYNEGRVVGYSAYEIYVRHALSEDPTTQPASELEWLSSSVAMGSSMLLRIPVDSVAGHHFIELSLPSDSNLAAANTIIGSLFLGEASFRKVDSDTAADPDTLAWANKITSYGPLLTNDSSRPSVGSHADSYVEYPRTLTSKLSSAQQSQILNYIKIVDGIVIQPGTWIATNSTPPHDLTISSTADPPDFSKSAKIRIYLSDKVDQEFYVLLTGFTLKTVLAGVGGLDGSTNTTTNMNSNGGFLGPAVFPWANKIVFSVPPAYVNYFLDNRYTRALQKRRTSSDSESYSTSRSVHSVSVIDMESASNPNAYYSSSDGNIYVRYQSLSSRPSDWADYYTYYYQLVSGTYQSVAGNTAPDASGTWPQNKYFKKVLPTLRVQVTDCNLTVGDSVLTVYQRNTILPPALYASRISQLGESTLNPLDTIAPGTVKLYEDESAESTAKTLEDEIPGNFALLRNTTDYVVKELNASQTVVPVAEASIIDLKNSLRFEDLLPPFFQVEGTYNKNGESYPFGREHQPSDLELVNQNAISLKRVTGKLSSRIQELCGYEYTDAAFQSGGIWSHATMNLVNQIPSADRSSYYYLVNARASAPNNPIVFPVRKSDHVMDVTVWYGIEMRVNGAIWYPQFVNDASSIANSAFLGSWWGGQNFNTDHTLAGLGGLPAYIGGWAYVVGDEHPTVASRIDTTQQLVYVRDSILPADRNGKTFEQYYTEVKLSDLFSSAQLDGILPEFQNCPLQEFLYTALYKDLGTGELLPANSKNVQQPLYFCTNTSTTSNVVVGVQFTLANNAETVGKPQYVTIPDDLVDISSSATGVLTQTGNKQAISLSMTDKNLKMYNFRGDSGSTITPTDGNIRWEDLLIALSENKCIDILNTARFISELNNRLTSGNGINISEDSINNILTLSTKFAPNDQQGVGISVAYDAQGQIVITNTLPDYSNSNYSRLSNDSYLLSVPNNFTVPSMNAIRVDYAVSNDKKTIAIRIRFQTANNNHIGNSNFGYSCYIKETGSSATFSTSIPSGEEQDWHYSTYNGTHTGTSIALNDALETFAFLHTLDSDAAYQKSNIINITFIDDNADDAYEELTSVPADWEDNWSHYYEKIVQGGTTIYQSLSIYSSAPTFTTWPSATYYQKTEITYSDLFIGGKQGRSNYRFEDTTGSTSGIWNITDATRASWSASCGLRAGATYSGEHLTSNQLAAPNADLAILGFSYADGFNSQFPNSYNTGSSPASSVHINMDVTGIFKYQG